MRACLVTGATGFLGREIVRELAAAGYAVHALVRAGSDQAGLSELPIAFHAGDLLEPESLREALRSFRAAAGDAALSVVHSAAVISYRTRDGALQRAANVEATRALLAAAREVGVERLVHVSSILALGHAPDAATDLDETAAFNAEHLGNDYANTKHAGEVAALAASDDELEVVVVSPGAVFGRNRRLSNTGRFVQTVARRPLLGLFAPPGGLSVVGVRDVGRGVLLALERGRTGRRYLLCESNVSLAELYRMLFARCGRGRVLATVPRPLWRVVILGARLVDRIVPLSFATPQALELLAVHFRADSSRARRELGWDPAPFADVLDEALELAD